VERDSVPSREKTPEERMRDMQSELITAQLKLQKARRNIDILERKMHWVLHRPDEMLRREMRFIEETGIVPNREDLMKMHIKEANSLARPPRLHLRAAKVGSIDECKSEH